MSNSKILLSLFFDVNRTYIAVSQLKNEIMELLYINSTEHPITAFDDLQQVEEAGKSELLNIFNEIDFKFDEINIALSNDNFAITQIPFKPDITGKELTTLLGLEIKHLYENKKFNELNFILTPFFENQSIGDYVFVTIYGNLIKKNLGSLLSPKGKVNRITTNQFAALNSFKFNYPEYANENNLLLGMYENELQVNLFINGKPFEIYFRLHHGGNDLLKKSITEIQTLKDKYKLHNIKVFVYGNLLTASILDKIALNFDRADILRLNAFRKYTTKLDDRIKEYCSHTAHIYPACLGASLPDFTEQILLIPDENH